MARMYPTDECEPCRPGEVVRAPDGAWKRQPTPHSASLCPPVKEQPLYDVIQEALQRHLQGVSFRERNAGPKIDMNMRDEGASVCVCVFL